MSLSKTSASARTTWSSGRCDGSSATRRARDEREAREFWIGGGTGNQPEAAEAVPRVCRVSQAIFGLIGVVVGALTTGGTQLYLAWRGERREIRRAKRLVASELAQNGVLLAAVSAQKQVPYYAEGRPLVTSAWEQTRSHLALALDEDLFTRLALAYSLLETDRERLRMAMNAPDESPALAEMAASVGRVAEDLEELRRELLS